MFKKMFAVILVSILMFSSFGFENIKVSAEKSNNQTATFNKIIENSGEKNDVLKFKSEAITEDLKEVSLENNIKRTVKKEENGTIKINLSGERETLNSNDEVEMVQVNDEIVLVSETEIYINGKRLSEEELNAEFSLEPKVNLLNSSGYSWLTRWSQNSRGDYNLRTYETADVFMDEAKGGYRSINEPYGTGFVDFRNLESQVTSNRNTIVTNAPLLAAALGVTAISWASVIGAISGGISAAGFAINIYNASTDGRSSMKQAYNLLGQL